MSARRNTFTSLLATAALLTAPLSAPAQTSDTPVNLVRIKERTLNDMVDALLPMTFTGTTPITREVCFIWCRTITFCEGKWRATISEMTLDTQPGGIKVSGRVSGTYQCYDGINFVTEIDASTGQVRYEASDNSLRLVVPASIRPCFATPIGSICANRQPVSIDIPTVYLRMAKLNFETPAGENYVALTASDIAVTTTDDYLELEGNVSVW